MPKSDDPKCYFCKQDNVGDQDYCYGCGSYICVDCDDEVQAIGTHTPEEHIDDEDYPEDDYDGEDWDDE